MFSSAPTSFNAPVNSNVSFFDAAIPGTLPVLNRRCVEAGVLTSLALGLRLNHVSYFDRKHYFYADLPAGYQITQQRQALAVDGKFTFPVEGKDLPGGGKQRANTCFTKETGIVQLQLEQDSGKSLHDLEGGKSLIDLNRCGIGLMEIVFGPDLRHGEEAAGLVRELRLILERVGSCLGRMEQGELRVDANISVRRPGDELGVRTEVKNINSVRSVSQVNLKIQILFTLVQLQAIEYEVARQIAVLEGGGIVENETRSFDVLSRRTMPMRDKEAKQDYRFMPEPNLPPLRLCDSDIAPPTSPNMVDIAPLRMALPQLPSETRKRLESEEGLSPAIANRLVASPQLLSFYFKCTEVKPKSRKEVADLILILVTEHCNNTNQQLDQLALKPEQLVEVSNMRQEGEISHMAVKEVVAALLSGEHKEAREAVQAKGLYLIKDETVILQFVQELMNNNDKLIKQWRTSEGKKRGKALQALVSVANKDPRAERVDMAVFMRTLQNSLEIS